MGKLTGLNRKLPKRGYTIARDEAIHETPYTLESLDRMGKIYYERDATGRLVRRRFKRWGKQPYKPKPKRKQKKRTSTKRKYKRKR